MTSVRASLRPLRLTGAKAKWLIIDALLPTLLVVVIWWPLGAWLLTGEGYVYERVLGGGDLLAITFAFLAASTTEQLLSESTTAHNDTVSVILKAATMIFLMFAGVMYGALKIHHALYEFKPDRAGHIEPELHQMATFSLVYCGFTIVYIYLAKSWFERLK